MLIYYDVLGFTGQFHGDFRAIYDSKKNVCASWPRISFTRQVPLPSVSADLEAASRIGIGLPMRQGSSCIQLMLMIRRLLAQWASGPLGCPRAMGQTEQHLETKAPGKASAFNLETCHHGRAEVICKVAPGVIYGASMVIYWDSLGFPGDFTRCFYVNLWGFTGVWWWFYGDLKVILCWFNGQSFIGI